MSLFVQPTPATAPKTSNTIWVSVALAAVMVILAVAQLYRFEDFPNVIADIGLPGGATWASTYAALLVTGEVLAIPFLLRMMLSPAMRIVSMVSGWLVIAGWLSIVVWSNLVLDHEVNSGILGAAVPIEQGWWVVCIFVALGLLAAWSAWGMWPCRKDGTKQ
jgi:hypothetical protein